MQRGEEIKQGSAKGPSLLFSFFLTFIKAIKMEELPLKINYFPRGGGREGGNARQIPLKLLIFCVEAFLKLEFITT